ncbi:hypothetical protein [Chitinimonas koreensis]|uniref:hypothetical protein n=1 Tax=Chitinimonas koreensis TaxID=356302 RepID=UPI0004108618|nr:hypothetical protein [Chitinimonas koreensis]QNM94897.1 hypothetical protein H9L41_13295 [Chitinimonas koreensis]
MPILQGDLQFVRPERLADDVDGGGAATGVLIVPGEENNVFDDISPHSDRVTGNVSLRKVFASVRTEDPDPLFKAMLTVDEPPADPRVAVTLFTTSDWFDRRGAARDRVERYLARSVRWSGNLLDTQLEGQGTIAIIQREEVPLPKVGQVFVLVKNEGIAGEFEQYVRVTRVTAVIREFTVDVSSGGNPITVRRRVVTCELADPLRADFPGAQPSPYDTAAGASIRETVVANAARYYGASRLAEAAEPGAYRVRVESIYSQLVPSAQVETALVNLNAAGQVAPMVDSGGGEIALEVSAPVGPGQVIYIGSGLLPGATRVEYAGQTLVDAGGVLQLAGATVAAIDYGRGTLTFNASAPAWSGLKTIRTRFATQISRLGNSYSQPVTVESRSTRVVHTLVPIPAPGALTLSYRVQDQWIDLQDNGLGELRGSDAAFGAGHIDFETGTLDCTLGALPDVGSAIVMTWGTKVTTFNRADFTVPGAAVELSLQLPDGKYAQPGSVTVTWPDPEGGADLSVTDDGAGALEGDATGTVSYLDGRVRLLPAQLPLHGTEYALVCSYYDQPPQEHAVPSLPAPVGGYVEIPLPHTGIVPRSVNFALWVGQTPAPWISNTDVKLMVRDDGDGGLIGADGDIDYATGLLRVAASQFAVIASRTVEIAGWGGGASGGSAAVTGMSYSGQPCAVLRLEGLRYLNASGVEAHPVTATGGLSLDLTPRYAELIVAGSVRFALGGQVYADRTGSLYYALDPATGAGTLGGSIDRSTGRVLLTAWTPGAANTVQLQSLLTEVGGQPVADAQFRVPMAPLRPGLFNLVADAFDGTGTLSVNAGSDGLLEATGIQGQVDAQTGLVYLRFGRMVTAAGNESEPWYDADAVDGDGMIWRPEPREASSVRYNAVAYTYLPLSADLLGLDPVRLPSDGRVPMVRRGDVVSIHHTARTAFAGSVPGATVDVERERLAELRVVDAAGRYLPDDAYSADLDAGTAELADPLDLEGYTVPLFAEHRVEDIALVNDVQINGDLSLLRPLTHHYPLGEAVVSSCLQVGDLRARATPPFSQQTWLGTWSDAVQGPGTSAQYNHALYPVECGNLGAIQQRWRIEFTNSTTFKLIGEQVGEVATGNTSTDFAPLNPVTGRPYMVVRAAGWGGGWAAGNLLRTNTIAAFYPLWLARSVGIGPATGDSDAFRLRLLGAVDA